MGAAQTRSLVFGSSWQIVRLGDVPLTMKTQSCDVNRAPCAFVACLPVAMYRLGATIRDQPIVFTIAIPTIDVRSSPSIENLAW